MADLNIERIRNIGVRITDIDSGVSIESHTVEANLLRDILEELGRIRFHLAVTLGDSSEYESATSGAE